MDAMIDEMRRLMRLEFEQIQKRLDNIESRAQGQQHKPNRDYDRTHRGHNINDNHKSKMKIISFQGRADPEAYLDWEKHIKYIFDCHHYSEARKVKFAISEFTDYAITWWDQVVISRRRNLEEPITTWKDMKTIMRKRFVPSQNHRRVHQKIGGIEQRHRIVEDYTTKDMTMIRVDVKEGREATKVRVNQKIQDTVEFYPNEKLENLVCQTYTTRNEASSPKAERKESLATTTYQQICTMTTSAKTSQEVPKFVVSISESITENIILDVLREKQDEQEAKRKENKEKERIEIKAQTCEIESVIILLSCLHKAGSSPSYINFVIAGKYDEVYSPHYGSSLYMTQDLRTNLFEEREDDTIQITPRQAKHKINLIEEFKDLFNLKMYKKRAGERLEKERTKTEHERRRNRTVFRAKFLSKHGAIHGAVFNAKRRRVGG